MASGEEGMAPQRGCDARGAESIPRQVASDSGARGQVSERWGDQIFREAALLEIKWRSWQSRPRLFFLNGPDSHEKAFVKADSTLRSSQAVPHPSTNRALRRLTSEVRRDPVYSTWYGRQRVQTCNRVLKF